MEYKFQLLQQCGLLSVHLDKQLVSIILQVKKYLGTSVLWQFETYNYVLFLLYTSCGASIHFSLYKQSNLVFMYENL